MRILIFGDSIAQGFFDTKGGWVGRLASSYHEQTLTNMLADKKGYFEVYNLGISGETTEELSPRIEPEVIARRLYKDDELIVIATGINDAILRKNEVVNDVYEFQTKYEKLVHQAQKLTKHVVLVGLSAVDEGQTDPWPFSGTGKQWKNNRINLFEDTIKQSAERLDVPFIATHDQFLAELNTGKKLLSDGLHPSDKGHQLLYELIQPQLQAVITKI